MKVFNVLIFHLFFFFNHSIAQNNSFNGLFLNEQIQLSISLTGNEDQYTGQFKLQETSFPITAALQGDNTLIGTYPFHGNIVPIQLMKLNDNFILITEGVTIPLTFKQNSSLDNQAISATKSKIKPVDGSGANSINIPVASTTKVEDKAIGKSFADRYSGFQFNIPADWNGQQLEDGNYLIGHKTKPGFILVTSHAFASLNEMHQMAAQGIQEEGVQLRPIAPINKYGKNGLIADFGGVMQGQQVKAHSVGLLSPFGGGLTLTIAVRNDLYQPEYLTIIQTIANAVVFTKPSIAPIARNWTDRIKGKRLQYLKTANGFSDNIIIDCCSNGSFGYSNNSSGMSTGMTTLTYAGQDQGQGKWKVITRGQIALLVMTYNNGEVYEYKLTNGATHTQINLNGRRYFVRSGSSCP